MDSSSIRDRLCPSVRLRVYGAQRSVGSNLVLYSPILAVTDDTVLLSGDDGEPEPG